MKVLTVDHITVNMKDVEKSLKFYGEILELPFLEEIDMGDHVLHLYQLPGAKLELIEYKEEQKLVQTGNTDIGVYRHFAIKVDDLKELKARCDKAGYGINLEPSFIPQLDCSVMLFKDPNGVEIEAIQA